MYLLDTNVVSALRRRKIANEGLWQWAAGTALAEMFLSVVTILEIERGVLLVERRDAQQAAVLRAWLADNLLVDFADRVIAFDLTAARRCASLHIPDPRPERDAMIAATALVHGMTVVTRNVADFAPIGVPLIDPWRHAD